GELERHIRVYAVPQQMPGETSESVVEAAFGAVLREGLNPPLCGGNRRGIGATGCRLLRQGDEPGRRLGDRSIERGMIDVPSVSAPGDMHARRRDDVSA